MATVQINVELPEAFARRMKMDAALLGVTQISYTVAALRLLRSLPIGRRRVLFARQPRKVTGRPVKFARAVDPNNN